MVGVDRPGPVVAACADGYVAGASPVQGVVSSWAHILAGDTSVGASARSVALHWVVGSLGLFGHLPADLCRTRAGCRAPLFHSPLVGGARCLDRPGTGTCAHAHRFLNGV